MLLLRVTNRSPWCTRATSKRVVLLWRPSEPIVTQRRDALRSSKRAERSYRGIAFPM